MLWLILGILAGILIDRPFLRDRYYDGRFAGWFVCSLIDHGGHVQTHERGDVSWWQCDRCCQVLSVEVHLLNHEGGRLARQNSEE